MSSAGSSQSDRPAIFTEHSPESTDDDREWDFHGADTREYLHRLHPYPAKFIPQIPRRAILEWSSEGDLVMDPFMGCGTTLLEASLHNRRSVGIDNNAVAVLVSRAKVARYSEGDLEQLQAFITSLPSALAASSPERELLPSDTNYMYWFSEDIALRLASAKSLIVGLDEPLRTALLACLSSIVVRVSYQDSDTRYARIERETAASEVDDALIGRAKYLAAQLPSLIGRARADSDVHLADSRVIPFVEDDSVDLIVTSPPYLNAYDYHKYHRQRLHLIDGDVEFARKREIGKHDDFTRPRATPERYFEDMNACFAEWARVVRSGGRCLIVVGDAIVNKSPVPVGDTFVEHLGDNGFKVTRRWIRELQGTRRSFNVKNSRISHEHVLLAERTE